MHTRFSSLLLLVTASATAQPHGQLRGRVVDPTDAAVSALVRLIPGERDSPSARLTANENGDFLAKTMRPGIYSVTAYAAGFRRRDLRNVRIEAGQTTNLGNIRLDLSGCDTPHTNCDYFGPVPDDVKRIISRETVSVKLSSTIDLDPRSTTGPPEGADLRLARQNGVLSLVGVNGATMATPNTSAVDCSTAAYTTERLPVAGLGPGVDFCVRTTAGSLAHVFFIDDVENDTTELTLWYVTRTHR